MTSYAELLSTCTEFQENFTILNGKYNTALQELKAERAQVSKLQDSIGEAAKREEALTAQVRTLKKDLEDACTFREKLRTQAITLGSVQSKLEDTRRSMADMQTSYEQTIQQLSAQKEDLLRRSDVSSGGARLQELTKQVTELEERSAVLNAQVTEEREKFSQQLLAAHNALREQQTRNLEVEQRYRSLSNELTEMRATVRRSADLQNEAARLKERHASEAALAHKAAEDLRREVADLQARMHEQGELFEEEREMTRRERAEEQRATAGRLAALTNALNDATAVADRERERAAALHRDFQTAADDARAEHNAEVTALRHTLALTKEDRQRAAWRLQKAEEEVASCRAAQQQLESQLESAGQERQRLELQLAQAAQQEAWLSAGRRSAEERVGQLEGQLQRLMDEGRRAQQLEVEADRLRVQLRDREEELRDAGAHARQAEERAMETEEVAARRIRELKRELKDTQRCMRRESAEADSLKRRLLRALAEREAELSRIGPAAAAAASSYGGLRTVAHLADGAAGAGAGAGDDLISILKNQNSDAAQLNARLLELARA